MDIIIVGCGKLGANLAKSLSEENHNVTVFDKNEDIINNTVDLLDVQGVVGGATIRSDLEEAGVRKTDILIATTSSDEYNILSCIIAKKLGAKHTVARVRNPEYIKQINFMREELGISMLFNPDFNAALEISRIIQFPSAIHVESFADGLIDLAEVKIHSGSGFAEKTVWDISSHFNKKMLICAVSRGDEVYIPNGNFVINAEDKIYVTGRHRDLSSIVKEFNPGKKVASIKDILIIGGSRIAFYLAGMLESQRNIVLIEKDEMKCEQLSELLSETTVVCGDANEYDFLKEAGIEKMDAVITLTNSDELNILATVFAETCNVPKNITKIDNSNLSIVLNKVSSDSVIDVTSIAGDSIIHYVRAKKYAETGEMKTLYKLVDGRVEATEFIVDARMKNLNIPLNGISFKKDVLIASISRKGKLIFPRGDDVMLEGDRVVVVSKERKIEKINDIFD